MTSVHLACVAAVAAALNAAGASGDGPIVLERFGDPWRAGEPAGGIAVSGGPVVFGDFVHIQANIDGNGNNVVFDAGNEPSIAVDPSAPNRIAIGWRQFDTQISNFRQAGYNHSVDGGRTWAAKQVIEAGLFRSDPVLEAGPDGTFYFLSLRVTEQSEFFTDMFISSDGGASWPVKNFAFGGDKQWFAIDTTGGMGDGNIYQAWNIAGNMFFPDTFNRSPDGGVTWEDPLTYDPGEVAFPVFGLIDVGPDGAVYVAGAQNSADTDTFWVVRSSNAQNDAVIPTFDLITDIDLGGNLLIGDGPNPAGLLGQVNIAVDDSGGPNHGDVYVLCSVNPPGPDPMDVHFIRSDDSGQTFSDPIRVNDDPSRSNSWQWFGQMSVAPNGRIDVVWNSTSNSGQENVSELHYSSSTDGGLTWDPSTQLSPSFDSHVGFPNQDKLGDYYDMISDEVGAHLAWAATFNDEQDVYYLRIGDYDCNGNGVGDADDIADETSPDCNGNGIPDECEIAAGAVADDNGNGIPDECESACPWDCGDGDGEVGIVDFLALLSQWDEVGAPCDFDGGGVGITDFLKLLGNWGMCP